MIRFGDELIYLDPQKTGGTWMIHNLRKHCTLPVMTEHKNHPVSLYYSDRAFKFSTIRHPLGYWSSLYRYNLDWKGDLVLFTGDREKKEYHPMYESFDTFVEFMLDPENMNYVCSKMAWAYTKKLSMHMGLCEYRFLYLNLMGPKVWNQIDHQIETAPAGADMEWVHDMTIYDHLIKQEELEQGFENLRGMYPQWFDDEPILKQRINSAQTPEHAIELKSDVLRRELLDKEKRMVDLWESL